MKLHDFSPSGVEMVRLRHTTGVLPVADEVLELHVNVRMRGTCPPDVERIERELRSIVLEYDGRRARGAG